MRDKSAVETHHGANIKGVNNKHLLTSIINCLEYGILAPSVLNSQPWSLEIEDNTVIVKLDSSRLLPMADPRHQGAMFSLGCFVENCIIAGPFLGLQIKVIEEIGEVSELATVKLVFSEEKERLQKNYNSELVLAIKERVNNSLPYDIKKKLASGIIQMVENASVYPQIQLRVVQDNQKIERIAEVTRQAIEAFQVRREFRQEFAKYINGNWSKKKFGLPGYCIGLSLPMSYLMPWIIRFTNFGSKQGTASKVLMLSSSAVVVITTQKESLHQWYLSGRIFQRTVLKLTEKLVSYSILNAAAESESHARKLMSDLSLTGFPAVIFRVGYTTYRSSQKPRIPVERLLALSKS